MNSPRIGLPRFRKSERSAVHVVPQRLPSFLRALDALAIVTMLSVAAQGCSSAGQSEYRCDTTGCFECNGDACTPIPGPTVTPCSLPDDPSCPAGTKCTDLGCLGPCKADADCPRGTVCRGKDASGVGFCAAPTGKDPTILTCTFAKDCGASGKACIDGKCVDDKGCTAGAACLCKYSSDCGDGRICVDSSCTHRCDATTPCPSGEKCGPLGTCVADEKPTCGSADGGATCKSGEHCFDGHCTGGCAVDGDCKTATGARDPGLRCVGGACAANDAPVTTCTGASECDSTQKCVDGFCRWLCSTNDECRAHDARFGACAPAEGICREPTDLLAKCTTKAECAGKDCVDGQCK
jgi:hypothetical protein